MGVETQVFVFCDAQMFLSSRCTLVERFDEEVSGNYYLVVRMLYHIN